MRKERKTRKGEQPKGAISAKDLLVAIDAAQARQPGALNKLAGLMLDERTLRAAEAGDPKAKREVESAKRTVLWLGTEEG